MFETLNDEEEEVRVEIWRGRGEVRDYYIIPSEVKSFLDSDSICLFELYRSRSHFRPRTSPPNHFAHFDEKELKCLKRSV